MQALQAATDYCKPTPGGSRPALNVAAHSLMTVLRHPEQAFSFSWHITPCPASVPVDISGNKWTGKNA
jgi:hypothetical protein